MLLPGYYAAAMAGSEITISGWCPQKFYCEFNTGSKNLRNALLLVRAKPLHCFLWLRALRPRNTQHSLPFCSLVWLVLFV